MRVIAGTAKRIPLIAPKTAITRPTADRAKESLFNILAAELHGAHFLDIFCGSGAIGIEALSRGAEKAVFIDNNANAVSALKENLAKTKLAHKAEIIEATAEAALARLAENRKFDIIFLDPPYDSDLLEKTFAQVKDSGLLAGGGKIIAETDSKNYRIDVLAKSFTSHRIYGRTRFSFYSETSEED